MTISTMPIRLLLFVFVVFTVVPVSAQSHRASVRGVVVDPTGAAIPQVPFQITNEATGELRTSVTGGDGHFAVTLLPPGTYKIDVEQPGYKKYVSQTELSINQEFWLEIRLQLGNLSEEVVVTAPLVPLDKESAALGTVIDARQLAGLPLDGRNFLELSLLVPGARSCAAGLCQLASWRLRHDLKRCA